MDSILNKDLNTGSNYRTNLQQPTTKVK